MAEPPGSQLGLGIEAVEWLPVGETSITVTVTGRWRRRPSWQGRPVLVIESEGRRHRFPAIPDPVSVAGAAPGTWRISFSVPAWLGSGLGVRAWLQLGVVLVPLPPVAEQQGPAVGRGDAAQSPPSEPEVTESPREPEMGDLPAEAVPEDEPQTSDMLTAAAELTTRIKQLDAERRAASARAEAEELRRAELERQLAETRLHAEHSQRLAREAELERERVLNAPEAMRRTSWRAQLPAELELARRAPPARDGSHRGRLNGDLARRTLEQLRREQEAARASELDHWRTRTAELERQLGESARRAEQLYEVIEDLRSVLDVIRAASAAEGGASAAEDRAPAAEDNPGGVATGADSPSAAPPDATPDVQPGRLDAALSRLRETIPPVDDDESAEGPKDTAAQTAAGDGAPGDRAAGDGAAGDGAAGDGAAESSEQPESEQRPPEPESELRPSQPLPTPASPTRRSWLLRTLRALAKDDPATAGRVALGLLPAQRLASKDTLIYDLSLSDAGLFQITADAGGTRVERARRPRDPAGLDFRLKGELGTFARLLVASPIRRRLELGVAELTGSRKALAALLALIRTPYGIRELYAAGARLEPALALTLIAWMIEPKWTKGLRFTIAHRGPEASVYLRVPGGVRPSVSTTPPLGPVAATVVCEPDQLLAVLAADELEAATVRGRAEMLELLRGWVARAQGG